MKCKKHPYEAGDGVCASCLRERLYALIAAQNKLSPPAGVPDPRPSPLNRHLPFPRSASPCFSHRRSLGSEASAFNRFFSTPTNGNLTRPKHSSLLPSIFGRSRSESWESRSPFSWLSALMRRKKSGKSLEAVGLHLPLERGMSLVRDREEDHGEVSGYSSDFSAVGGMPGPTPIRKPGPRRGKGDLWLRGLPEPVGSVEPESPAG
ncbi:uncharacterized protein LOC110023941 [Phalaenopsis equestris]|uniref:uncharacterized protein LOC110023941 n=1 Tax=Phalaenopsis equestris TaxID=78828 RepID=UPI0009E219FC|nr:uncharacterized protein LOC110023941 [Phalaenopsis equestris]